MLAELKRVRFPVEIGLLVALAVFLPLSEALKGILWLAYSVTWLVNRARARDFDGPWNLWDSLIVLWIASAFLAAAFAGLHESEWAGARDLVRYASLLWLVKRGGYSPRELAWVLGALVASTFAGLLFSHYQVWIARQIHYVNLYSVGHQNHSAIYMAIMLGVVTSWIFARWQVWAPARRTGALVILALVLGSLVLTASRGAIAIGLSWVPILAAVWWRRWRAPLAASIALIAIIVAAAVMGGVEVVRKHEKNLNEANVLAYRDGIWRMAFATWERYPWFGVGMKNYSAVTHEKVRAWRAAEGRDYDESRYTVTSHAHSLYFNTLAERGAVGTAALAAILVAWLVSLVRNRPRAADGDLDWLLWGSAAGAWFITVAVGTVNTTLHTEHGILAALLLGLWLCRRPTHRAS